MILFSTRMSTSGRLRPWSAWVYAEIKPLQVLGVPLVPPRCGIWARLHHADDGVHERVVVCRRASTLCPHKFFYVFAEGVDGLVDRRGII